MRHGEIAVKWDNTSTRRRFDKPHIGRYDAKLKCRQLHNRERCDADFAAAYGKILYAIRLILLLFLSMRIAPGGSADIVRYAAPSSRAHFARYYFGSATLRSNGRRRHITTADAAAMRIRFR